MGFELVNLSEITSHPSPNYLLVLQMAQEKAIAAEAGLLIVESDVIVKKHTLQSLFDGAQASSRGQGGGMGSGIMALLFLTRSHNKEACPCPIPR